MKQCSDCKNVKSFDAFHKKKTSKDGHQSKCKECNNKSVRKWQDENPDAFEVIWRRHSYGERARLKKRARIYGLTEAELEAMLMATEGLCDICDQPPRKWLVVDHCHQTGRVRGILCEDCNRGIGLLKESKDVLLSAVKYLGE